MTAPVVEATALSHIALRVRDVTRSIGWYQAVLGYEVLTDGHAPTPDRTRSAMGLICGGGLALELLETPAGKAHDIETLGIAGLSLTVANLDAAVAAYNASAYRGDGPRAFCIEADDWRVSFLFDPDRNVVELVQQPPGALSIAGFADTLRRRRDQNTGAAEPPAGSRR
jgi:catechol 2,3-dioxygenase-like lactoylglutathione lyase family enzyme